MGGRGTRRAAAPAQEPGRSEGIQDGWAAETNHSVRDVSAVAADAWAALVLLDRGWAVAS